MITGSVTLKVNGNALGGNVFPTGTTVNVRADGQADIPATAAGTPVSYDVKVYVSAKKTSGQSCSLIENSTVGTFATEATARTVTVVPPSIVAVGDDGFYLVVATITAQGKDAQGNPVGGVLDLGGANGGFQIGDPDDIFPKDYCVCTGADAPVTGCTGPSPAAGAKVMVAQGGSVTVSAAFKGKIVGKANTNKQIQREMKFTVTGPGVNAKFEDGRTFNGPATDDTPVSPLVITPTGPGMCTATLSIRLYVLATPQTDPACKTDLPSVSNSWSFEVVRPSSSSSSSSSNSSGSSDSSNPSGSSNSSNSSNLPPSSSGSSGSNSSF